MTKSKVMYWLAAGLSLIGLVAHEALGALMIALFVLAARRPGNIVVAFIATAMSVGFAALGIGLGIYAGSVVWETPAPYVWSLIAIIGGVGLGLEWNANTATIQSLN